MAPTVSTAAVAILATLGAVVLASQVPVTRQHLALALQGALPGDNEAAVDFADQLISQAPADQIPPGVREAIDIFWQGNNRSYTLYTPTTYNAGAATPVLLSIHSAGTSPLISATWTALDWVAEEGAFLTVYPKGTDRTFNAGPRCCQSNSSIDDVGFMRAIVDDVARRRTVDLRRVYATGQSNGGYMSHRLACDASTWIAAIAPVSADSPWPVFDANCNPTRVMPVLSFHGTNDNAVSYEGGYETVQWWRAHNGCSATPQITFTGGVTTCENWINCLPQADGTATNVTFCSAEGVGHIYWPGSWLPGVNKDIDGSREVWKFVSQYRL